MADSGTTSLDRAHALRLRGDSEAALRLGGSILAAHEDDIGAALLLAQLLREAGRAAVADELAARCCDGYIRRGDLPRAVIAALRPSAAPDPRALQAISEAFGAGSPRVSQEGSVRPPPLPHPVDVAPFFENATGPALLDAAEKAARRFLQTKDPVGSDRPLPRLPLFGALPPAILRKLLSRLSLRELAAGDYALREGEAGHEAFVLARGVLHAVRESTGGRQLLGVLGPGALFGEMALVSAAPRAASVVAVEAVQLLSVSRDALEELSAQEPALGRELSAFCHERMIGNLVRHSALLSAIPPAQRDAVIARFDVRRVDAGELLVQEGEEASALYLIASGGVQVRSRDADGDRVVVAELGPGEVVGEISLVLRRPATAEVIALHPSVALTLTREQFHEAIREHPTLLRELYELAVAREEQTRSIVAQQAEDAAEVVLL